MPRPLLALAALLACNAGAPATAPAKSADPAKPAAPACADRVAALRTLFADAPTDPVVVNTPPGLELPTTARGAAVTDGLPLFVRADGSLDINSRTHAAVADAEGALREEADRAVTMSQYGRGEPRLLVVADRRAPAAAIRELADAVPPAVGVALVANLAGDTVPAGPPIPDTVRDILAEPADQRAIKLAREVEKAIGTCGPIRKIFEELAVSDPAQRSKHLFTGLPAAIEACTCELDVDRLVALVWTIAGKTEPAKRALVLSRDPAVAAVDLPATATVADIVAQAETRDPLRLAAPK